MPEQLHPIVAQLSLNIEQRPAVSARGCDVVVTAGAGTGKTRTLVARYLSLLADGKPLRSVVAITFTRKAAREMRNRVRGEIQRYLGEGDPTSEERVHWQSIYAGLDAARIGTIHSLCGELLRAHPAEAGVDPHFQVLEEGQAALLRTEVLETALAWAADAPEAVSLFSLLDGPDGLRDALQTLLAHRLDAASAFHGTETEPLARWQRIMTVRQRARLKALISDPVWTEAVTTLRESKPTNRDDRMAIQRRGALKAIGGLLESKTGDLAWSEDSNDRLPPEEKLEEQLASLSTLDEVNLVGGSYKAWSGGKAEKAAVKEALRSLRGLWRDHGYLLSLHLTPLDERLAAAIPRLQALFQFACERYQMEKENRRALDFNDLESGALTLLQHHPTIRERWQRQVEAVLVDEFQDTNERQRNLVRLLGDAPGPTRPGEVPRSTGELFIVGDAKQSIYGFRGADVTVFRAERERVTESGGEAHPLATSYRAHRGLVKALNDLLKPVLGQTPDPQRPWSEPFAPIQPFRETPSPGIEPPYVELHLTVGSKSDGALDRAARALTERLMRMVDAGKPAAVSFGDMAILCRASSSFSAYEDALDEAGLPYLTVAGRGFYDRPEVRDLLNALQAVTDPTDDLALVGLLRSPAFALSDEAVFRLVQARDEASALNDGVDPLWDVLCRGDVELGADAKRRATRAAAMIGRLQRMAGRARVGDLLKAFLDETNYRSALLKAGQQRAVRNVDKLLGDAHASGLVGVGSFLEYVGGLQDSGAREGEARASAGDAVQIMSVHQAKGLEFPIVVLGDAGWSSRGRGQDVLLDSALGVLLPLRDEEGDDLPAVYRLAQAREGDKAAAESDRLLYVAATRAREKLLVSGCLSGIRQDGTPYKLRGWLGKLGRPLGLDEVEIAYDEEGTLVHREELHLGETTAECFIYEPACIFHRPAASATAQERTTTETPLPPPLLAPIPQKDNVEEELPLQRVDLVVPQTESVRAPSRVVGELVHEALANWRFPEAQDDEAFSGWLRARARTKGLTDAHQLKDARRRCRRLLVRLREHPLFQELLTAEQLLHEVPYSVKQQGRVESGLLDLLYQRHGTWTVVEFKTDRVDGPVDFERLLEERDYVSQARRYGRAAEQLLGKRPRCLLCMLDYSSSARVYVVPDDGPLRQADL